jgi:hypothetical protein
MSDSCDRGIVVQKVLFFGISVGSESSRRANPHELCEILALSPRVNRRNLSGRNAHDN